MGKFFLPLFFLLVSIINAQILFSQQRKTDSLTGFKTVAAGEEYKASGFYRWLWGSNYRNVWTTPVTVKDLMLNTVKGGLIPFNADRNGAAKILYLKNVANEEYELRSVNKKPGKILSPALQGTIAESRVNDEVSISNPYALATLPYLAEKSKVYYTSPAYYYLPEQRTLGIYSYLQNDLYILERSLSSDQQNTANADNVANYIDTKTLLDLLLNNNNIIIDEHTYIRARLFDMFINDWNRHEGQWQWGEKRTGNKITYIPFPQNHDQAYSKHNGLLLGVALGISGLKYAESFNDNFKNVNTFNFQAKNLDRRFTITSTLDEWRTAAASLQNSLTDNVIETAVQALPKEIYPLVGNDMIQKLKARREHLVEWATEYYYFLSEEVEIPGSFQSEEYDVQRINENETLVQVFSFNNQNNKNDSPFYTRTFKSSETNELRLFGLGGNDKYIFSGSNNAIDVKIIDGINKDSIINLSASNANINNLKVYGDKNNINTNLNRLNINEDTLFRSYRYNWYNYNAKSLTPAIFYSTDDRLFLTLAYRVKHNAWGKVPYASAQVFDLHYSLMENGFSFTYKASFPDLFAKTNLGIVANIDQVRWIYFFGLGNDTKFENYKLKYYTMRIRQWVVQPALIKNFGKSSLSIYANMQGIKIINDTGRYIVKAPANKTGFDWQTYAGGGIAYIYQNLDDPIIPERGVYFVADASAKQNLKNSSSYYMKYEGVAHFYIPLISKFSLNLRTGAATITGNPEFYFYPSIGGPLLRGVVLDRFRGKTAFYNTNDIRYISNLHFKFFSGKAGLLAFFDNGRVWLPSEKSDTWHTAFGGGIIVAPLNSFYLDLTYGFSKKETSIQARATFPIQ